MSSMTGVTESKPTLLPGNGYIVGINQIYDVSIAVATESGSFRHVSA